MTSQEESTTLIAGLNLEVGFLRLANQQLWDKVKLLERELRKKQEIIDLLEVCHEDDAASLPVGEA